MIKRYLLLMIAALLSAHISYAQDPYTQVNLPKVLPPSPAAQNFMRYGEIPVDYSTGVPNISVPLYTLNSRQLSIPISVSYHASGIKVQDRASVVGLGWVLNYGGAINATILGNTGTSLPTYHNLTAYTAGREAANASLISMQSWFDETMIEFTHSAWQSPRYNYQLPNGESGVFRYDYMTDSLIKLPYSPVKILPETDATPGVSPSEIIDEKGVIYDFAALVSQTRSLTSMISADKTDTIRFTYKTGINTYYMPNWSSVLQLCYTPSASSSSDVSWSPTQNQSNDIAPFYETTELLPDSIISASTIVTFSVANDRQDMPSVFGHYRVIGMKVFSRASGQLLKSFEFNEDYFGTSTDNNQRLKLNGITVKDNDNVSVQNYSFDYDTTATLPPYPENYSSPSDNRFHEDYWGYYNGVAAFSMVPREFTPADIPINGWVGPVAPTPVIGSYYTNRNPDSLYAKADMLTTIHYPTGGKTVFTFEPNRSNAYDYPSGFTVPDIVGGFRIRRIDNYLADGTLEDYKFYTYGVAKTRTININLFTQVQRTVSYQTYDSMPYRSLIAYPNLIISSVPLVPLTCDNGPPVFYDSVTEYYGSGTTNAGKTVYSYDTPPAIPSDDSGFDIPLTAGPYLFDRGNYIPKMLDKKVYRRLNNGSYTPVKQTANSYSTALTTSYPMGMKTTQLASWNTEDAHNFDYPGWMIAPIDLGYYDAGGSGQFGGAGANYMLAVTDLAATQEVSNITQTVEYDYNPNDSTKYVATTTNYNYGQLLGYTLGKPANLLPTQKTVNSSLGDYYITQYKYPLDSVAVAPYSTMVSENILTPVILQSNYKNSTSTFLNSQATNYNAFTSTIIEPKRVQTTQGSGSTETRVVYSAYDNSANATQVSKANGPQISYIWGYNKVYPIAQATNAPVNDIFYQGFEETDYNSMSAKTGHYGHFGIFTQTLTGLDAGDYILSYWTNATGVWTFNSSVVTVSGSSYMLSAGSPSLIVDDIRFYPANAQMETFTYDPNIGQTSATDAKNEITYYEYDNFQRLMNVKDTNGNIVKHYDYHYKP